MGEANLYELELSFKQNDNASDTENLKFGLRENSTYFDEEVGA